MIMDPFPHGHYEINTIFLSMLGIWPYQARAARYARRTFFIGIVTSQIIPQILGLVKFRKDPEIVIQSIPPIATVLIYFAKITNTILNFDKMFELLQRMKIDWTSLIHHSEIGILHDYAQIGKRFTIAYAVGMYFCMTVYLGQPAFPKLLEALKLTNESRPSELPFPVYYCGIDIETYYYHILLHAVVTSTTSITTIIAVDTMFMVHVQHACGMFTIIGRQLQRMAVKAENNDKIHSRPEDDVAFQYIVDCIKKHKEAIEFAELMECAYTWAFFSIVGFNMIMMSATGYQTVVEMDENPKEAMRFAAFTFAQMLHLFVQSYFSQRLRDHSEQVREYVYQAEWHSTSLCAQKLISLVIMRTEVPCQLTAGRFLAMSLENFTMILKTSMSYFTLLRSMQ